ncbi:MAG: T9SS type A sorting domain-containing protein [Bacteroidetes bacterium]|nr:T9SS type A sorting domain-containing protein [Bacteroidota bacterium]MBK8873819.1 T9SS type A sorting domain-containing protein [Bacteroidota bacterium]
MKYFINILFLVLNINFLHAQNQTNNWYFGFNAGITFNTNPPTALSGGQVYTYEGCSSISDSAGNLLFYSAGDTVWCSNHTIMPNGTGLWGNKSATQSCLILPKPSSSTLYYLITTPALEVQSHPLAYSIIDKSLNGGLGAVTIKNVSLLDSSTEKVAATYHQNGTDIWIIAHEFPNNNFYAYLLTAAGISPAPVISSVGISISINTYRQGYLKASPCGTQLAMANFGLTSLELFDFDNSTGVVSNALLLGQWASGMMGVEFSPDNSKLYGSFNAPPIVLQYDLGAGSPAAIIASMDTIGIATSSYIGALQTGLDGRIYLSKYNSGYLNCITNPNQLGNLCGYIENYVSLSGTGAYGLPNCLSSFFCNITSDVNSIVYENAISFHPNPFVDEISITFQKQNIKQVSFAIKSIFGQTVFYKEEINLSSTYTKTIDLCFLANGIYLIDVIVDGERTVKKIVKG